MWLGNRSNIHHNMIEQCLAALVMVRFGAMICDCVYYVCLIASRVNFDSIFYILYAMQLT